MAVGVARDGTRCGEHGFRALSLAMPFPVLIGVLLLPGVLGTACKQEQLPTIGTVLRRLEEPIERGCMELKETVLRTLARSKPDRAAGVEVTENKDGFTMATPWSKSLPRPHGFRKTANLVTAGPQRCTVRVTSEAKLESEPSMVTTDWATALEILGNVNPAKAQEISTLLVPYKM